MKKACLQNTRRQAFCCSALRLPLMRELSAKLTEGETLNDRIDMFEHAHGR